MKTFILAALLAATAASGVVVTAQPAAADFVPPTTTIIAKLKRPVFNPNLIIKECVPCRYKERREGR